MPTATATIAAKAESYVRELLIDELSDDYRYHNLAHTLSVREAAIRIGEYMDMDSEELELLELAALFHDTGFVRTYDGHEHASMQIAEDFLRQEGMEENKIKLITDAIAATENNVAAQGRIAQVLCDADMSNLGSVTYLDTLKELRSEWAVIKGETYDDVDWYKLNRKFIKQHQYHTQAARELYDEEAQQNRDRMKVLRKQAKKKGGTSTIHNSKAAQMMFKTSLRNHLDLSTLADNKANIMLSVNALIITIVMPMAISYVSDKVYLLPPMVCLTLTCLTSMIFATLATRPIKMEGDTSLDQVRAGNSNLFFFGNFWRMNYDTYHKGIQEVVQEEDNLEDTIIRDLFFLGKSLGYKYKLLRTCYTIFMVGMVLTVIIFTISYHMHSNVS